MPQLDTATYLPQVFWLTIVFVFFYLISNKNIIPTISRPLKAREKKLILGTKLLGTLKTNNQDLEKNFSIVFSNYCSTASSLLNKKSSETIKWQEKEVLNSITKDSTVSSTINMNNKYVQKITDLYVTKNSLSSYLLYLNQNK